MAADTETPLASVVMPTFRHARFIARAIESVCAQTLRSWELRIIDDASPDETREVVAPYLTDERIGYVALPRNVGLGAALNAGLAASRGRYVAYLPSDDVYYADHLTALVEALEAAADAVAAYAGVRHHYNRKAAGRIPGEPLQLVQTLHRATSLRWIERTELVTDDLDRMFWRRLAGHGRFVETGVVTCEWTDHPDQLHKTIREPLGGINRYRQRFGVPHPLRFHSSIGDRIDEVERYRRFRERPPTPPASDGLRILLVGELAYNPERVLALEELGHRLYGLWMRDPYWYNTVGPMPFGHVEDVPFEDWRAELRRIRPDVIYALLNWQAVPFARRVLEDNPGIPFVWHFKEGPFICREKGTWDALVDLYRGADGLAYSSAEMRDWFFTVLPELEARPTLVLDGDLPKRDWLDAPRSRRLSEDDGEIHTVVPGRPIGLHPPNVAELAAHGIHVHFYGDFTHGQWKGWIEEAGALAPHHLHLHAQADQPRWVEEFSRYDAGWLHAFASENGGELRRAIWDDLNCPARLATLAAAGLPVIQRDNRGSLVAAERLTRAHDVGVFFEDVEGLRAQLSDAAEMARLQDNMWSCREEFTFDRHAPRLVDLFREVMSGSRGRRAATRRTRHATGGLSS
ncbi:MAG TPA: glycosyltransferase [Gammaproteobacteria bacterium]|nr:glycosyltransferase [Gammaproteobacteria bacterium]